VAVGQRFRGGARYRGQRLLTAATRPAKTTPITVQRRLGSDPPLTGAGSNR